MTDYLRFGNVKIIDQLLQLLVVVEMLLVVCQGRVSEWILKL
jgi:hypothetical protein